jgi:arsenate reductase-like glutaredoxin family protein
LALFALSACRKPTPATPPPEQVKLPPLEVKKDGAWLYTYVDDKGQFTTVDKPEDVPAAARRMVRVIDPSKGVADRRDTTNVYVVDANELLAKGKASAHTLSRQAFETGALAQLPPGEASLLSERPDGGALAGEAPASAAGPPVVTVYGAAWCGVCRQARQYLAGRKIPFVYKDIEKDAAAARELSEKAARLGIPADRVPIIDVRGRLLIGFDQARIEALLGQPT